MAMRRVVARLDKYRPVLVLTREHALDRLTHVAVAPITGTARGIRTEVPVGPENGLDQASVMADQRVDLASAARFAASPGTG